MHMEYDTFPIFRYYCSSREWSLCRIPNYHIKNQDEEMPWGPFDLSMYCMCRGQWTESANHSIIIAPTPF